MQNKLSKSSFTAIIALIFLIIGYQSAFFIQRAAENYILAKKDKVDTLFVFVDKKDTCLKMTQRKVSAHSEYVNKIRRQASSLFYFNPNTVDIDSLILLGFSRKQAMSIDNFRKKGARFFNKEDFKRCYVVSEKQYSRLEKYIQIPKLDLNLADSASLEALPYIGKYLAANIVAYRKRLYGFSSIEQLKDFKYIDEEKFQKLSKMLKIGSPASFPLWHLDEQELSTHPYIDRATAKAINKFKALKDSSQWSIEALIKANIISQDSKLGKINIQKAI